jgi:hypothetical protein
MENNEYPNLKRGRGRPKGSKDRKWASIEHWYAMIEQNMDKLTPREKVSLGKWGCEILIGKMKEIASPNESKQNAEQAMAILKEMESKASK